MMQWIVCSDYPERQQSYHASQFTALRGILQAQSKWARFTRAMGFTRPQDHFLLMQRDYHERKERQYEQGHNGETIAHDWLDRRIHCSCVAFEGVPTGHGDIDILALTPYGLTLYEVKNWNGDCQFYPDHCETRGPHGFHRSAKNPVWQILQNRQTVQQWIGTTPYAGLPVIGILFWANDSASVTTRGQLPYRLLQPRWWLGERKALGLRRNRQPVLSQDEWLRAAEFFSKHMPSELH